MIQSEIRIASAPYASIAKLSEQTNPFRFFNLSSQSPSLFPAQKVVVFITFEAPHRVLFSKFRFRNLLSYFGQFCQFSSKWCKRLPSFVASSLPSLRVVNPLSGYCITSISNFNSGIQKKIFNGSSRLTADLGHNPTIGPLFCYIPLPQKFFRGPNHE